MKATLPNGTILDGTAAEIREALSGVGGGGPWTEPPVCIPFFWVVPCLYCGNRRPLLAPPGWYTCPACGNGYDDMASPNATITYTELSGLTDGIFSSGALAPTFTNN